MSNYEFAATLSGENPGPVVDQYLGLRQEGQKALMLETLAATHLPENRRKAFRAIVKLYERAQKLRQPIAHWLWGFCADIPDALLLIDPRDELRQKAGQVAAQKEVQVQALSAQQSPSMSSNDFPIHHAKVGAAMAKLTSDESYKDRILVYRAKDLEDIICQFEFANKMPREFHAVLYFDRGKPEIGEKIFQKLIQQPEIQSLLPPQD